MKWSPAAESQGCQGAVLHFSSQTQFDGAMPLGTGTLLQDQACLHAHGIALLIALMIA